MTFSILATVGIFVGESYAEELGDIILSLPSLEISSQTADQLCYAFILAESGAIRASRRRLQVLTARSR